MRISRGFVLLLFLAAAVPVQGTFLADFNAPTYQDANLAGQDGWASSPASGKIAVVNTVSDGRVKVMAASDAVKATKAGTGEAGDVWLEVDMLPEAGQGTGFFIWKLLIRDNANNDAAWWYGQANTAVPRSPLGTLAAVTIDVPTRLRAITHLATHTADYYYNKGAGWVSLGTLGGYTGVAPDWVRFENLQRTDGLSDYALFDNLSVVPEPGTLALLLFGTLVVVRRQGA